MRTSGKTVQILLAIVAAVLVVAALKATRPISMPLTFAFFIAVLVYPLQAWLNRRIPHWLSLIVVLLVLAAVLGVAVGALVVSAEIVEPKIPEYLDQLQQMAATVQSWAQARSIPLPTSLDGFSSQGGSNSLTQQAIGGIRSILSALSLFVLVVSLLVLLLLEVGEYYEKVKRAFPYPASDRLIEAVSNTSKKLRRYLFVMTFTSFLTGILTGLWCFILGVDLAFVWGLVGFVLNYVPTLGSIIAVIPPTLVAFLFNGVFRGVATLVGLAVIQVTLGNFVDPRLQGKSLHLSPLVALFSIMFWGWVWGIPGAVLGVPMTVSIILLSGEFKPTRGIAILLGELEVEDNPQK